MKKVIIENYDDKLLKKLDEFLKEQNLKLENDLDFRIALCEDDNIIATGSLKKNILKCIAVDNLHKGQGISNTILSELINEEYRIGNKDIFVYTKPKNLKFFIKYGFYPITDARDKIVFLENHENGIKKYFYDFNQNIDKAKKVFCIIVSSVEVLKNNKEKLNDISSNCDKLHIFITLNANEYKKNIELENSNITIHDKFYYLSSYNIFSKYFLKEEDILPCYSLISAKIIKYYIVKSLRISKIFILEDEVFKILINDYTDEFFKNSDLNIVKY